MIDVSCLDKYKLRQDYEDLVQDYILAILEGKDEKQALKCVVRNKNSSDRRFKQQAPSLYNEDGDCLDEEYYFRTDREEGETGSRLTDGTKDYVAKMSKTLNYITHLISVEKKTPGGKGGIYPVYFYRFATLREINISRTNEFRNIKPYYGILKERRKFSTMLKKEKRNEDRRNKRLALRAD